MIPENRGLNKLLEMWQCKSSIQPLKYFVKGKAVDVNGTLFELTTTECGVPQGSVLGVLSLTLSKKDT